MNAFHYAIFDFFAVHLGIFTFWFYGFLLSFFVVAMALYICTVDEITPREHSPGIALKNDPGKTIFR